MISWKLLRAAQKAPKWVFDIELLVLAYLAGRVPDNGRILEIGSWCGASTLALLAGITNKKAEVHCIDNWDDSDVAYRQDITGKQCRKSFFGRIQPFIAVGRAKVFEDDYRKVLPTLTKGRYDLIFVDGPHEKEHADPTVDGVLPLLAKEGVLIFHDAAQVVWPGVVEMCRKVSETGEFMSPRLVETMAIYGRVPNVTS